MKRFVSLVVIAVIGLTSSVASAEEGTQRELIVLVLFDATRPDHLGCYGYKKPTSPEIDALCKRGRRYTRAYANAPWTRPSTTSFLTGVNASRHQNETEDSKLPADVRTLAARLKRAGYTTAGFVANGNGGSLAALNRDFDVFHDTTNTYSKSVRGKTYNGLPTGEFITDKALEWLRKNDDDKVFMFLFFVDPHDPYRAPPKLEKLFLGDYQGKVRRHALWEYKNDYPAGERRSMIAIYDAAIRYADGALGRFVDGVEAEGFDLKKNATLFMSADHGEGFGEHGFYLHAHHFWDEVIHIPLVAVGPRFPSGSDGRLTQSLDVTRTIAELAGAPTDGLPGRSLLKPADADPFVISEYNEFGIHRQAIVSNRYKVIWQRPADWDWYKRTAVKKAYFPSVSFDEEVVHVFDLKSDPGEKKNLAAAPPEEAKKLLRRLRAFVNAE